MWEADIIFFSTDGVRIKLPPKRQGQYYAAITAQGKPFLFDRMKDRDFADKIDLFFHYDPFKSDIWLPWLPCRVRTVGGLDMESFAYSIPENELWTRSMSRTDGNGDDDVFLGHQDHYLVTLVSNCDEKRMETIRFLESHIKMDHYGRCNRNVENLPDSHKSQKELGGTYVNVFAQKMDILKKYRMTLVLENVRNVSYYVTEKIFHALASGTLPIYSGAPPEHVEKLLPCNDCVIFADRFAGLEELALYLKQLISDRAEYMKYFHWKRRPLRTSFLEMMNYCERNHHLQQGCIACEALLKLRKGSKMPLRFMFRDNAIISTTSML